MLFNLIADAMVNLERYRKIQMNEWHNPNKRRYRFTGPNVTKKLKDQVPHNGTAYVYYY